MAHWPGGGCPQLESTLKRQWGNFRALTSEASMNRFLAVPLFFVMVAAAPLQPVVQVATGDWSQLPALEHRNDNHLGSNGMARIFQLAAQRKCTIPGYTYRKLDLRVSFAVQYNADGSPARIVVPALNCPEAESIIASSVLAMVKGRDFAPHGPAADQGWYQGMLVWGYEADGQSKI